MKKHFLWFLSLLLLFVAACSVEQEATEPTSAPQEAEADTPAVVEDAADEETAVSDEAPQAETVADPEIAYDSDQRFSADKYDEYEIVTLLPRDAIPAIDNPQFVSADEADGAYDPDELVIGVEFNGDARAYSVPFLSSHEIVNDTVGGEKIAVTW